MNYPSSLDSKAPSERSGSRRSRGGLWGASVRTTRKSPRKMKIAPKAGQPVGARHASSSSAVSQFGYALARRMTPVSAAATTYAAAYKEARLADRRTGWKTAKALTSVDDAVRVAQVTRPAHAWRARPPTRARRGDSGRRSRRRRTGRRPSRRGPRGPASGRAKRRAGRSRRRRGRGAPGTRSPGSPSRPSAPRRGGRRARSRRPSRRPRARPCSGSRNSCSPCS